MYLKTNTHGFLSHLPHTHIHTCPVFEGDNKISKNWVQGAIFEKTYGETKRGGERKCKGAIPIHFLTIHYHDN